MGGPNKVDEWYLQSDYDFETAEAMFTSGRYIYAIFMCHLSLEKALIKSFTQDRTKEFLVDAKSIQQWIKQQ